MSHVFEPTTINSASDRSHRGPAIVLVGIAAMGIFIDRTCSLSLDLWLSLCVIAAIVWFVAHSVFAFRTSDLTNERLAAERPGTVEIAARWVSVVLLLAGWFGLAGAWHHWRWNCRFENDIANSATDEPQLVRMIGKVVQTPWVVKRQENELNRWQNPERTILVVECRSVVTDVDEKLDVSGQVRVSTNGALTSVSIGDLVEINGDLVRPNLPANPGDFDQRAFLQSQGISAIARTESVDGIQVIGRDRTVLDWLRVFRGALRNRAERLISNALAADTAPVAQAMLLGTRVQIDEETRRAFRESGLLHILAISGMNVGLLWSWLWSVCRWIGLSAKTSIWIVLVALPVYALVTDANPPIVRATVVAVIVAFGQLIGRTGSAVNSLALAGISVLIWNPSDLFNPGAQLSFLAVFAILHATNWLSMVQQQAACVTADAPLNDSLFRRLGKRFLRGAIEANIVGLAIWTITSPLVAREFHLVSPIGSLLTVLLVIPVTLLFWIGYSFLLVGLVWASAVAWLGVLFDFCLRAFLETVRTAASFKLGHVYVPAPPIWWTIGFYLFTLVPLLVIYRQRLAAAISVRSGLAWLVLGLAWGIWYPPHPGLTCTFISVGHGLGVMIDMNVPTDVKSHKSSFLPTKCVT